MLQVHRLLQEIERAFLHRGYRFFYRSVRRQKQHRYCRIHVLALAQDVQPRSTRHLQVSNHQQISSRAYLLNCRGAVRRFVHGVARALQCLAQHGAQLGLIFDKEERFHLFRFYHESRTLSAQPETRVQRREAALRTLKAVAHPGTVLSLGRKGFFYLLKTYDEQLFGGSSTAPSLDRRPIFSVGLPCPPAPASVVPIPFSWRRFLPASH